MKKVLIGIFSFVIVVLISIVGYRYFKYQDFIGKFYSDDGGYYEFGLFNWRNNTDGDDDIECSLWECDNQEGNLYYVKNGQLNLKMKTKGRMTTEYKLEKKGDKIYLYFYDANGNIASSYLKTL